VDNDGRVARRPGAALDIEGAEMADDTPLLDTLAVMTVASLENCNLEPRELMLVRIAALASVGAPPASYLVNAGTAIDAGITLEDVQGVLVAIAPIVGTARTVSAASDVAQALGFAIAALEAELEAGAG
jgi:alkylhydroperoxidase/carboxymuconolactone decarboxylase family protein YurZ